MKFAILFANVGPFVDPENLARLGRKAEEVGFESLWTVEHAVVPCDYTAEYPYSNTGKMPGPENSPIPDPLLPLAYLAAVTERIKLGTGVMILPQRHPVYVAKEAATLDVLSKGRAILGVGVGWLHEEFAALGIPFDDRGSRTRESVAAIRSLWADGPSTFSGKFFNWGPVESHPKPVQAGGVPIVVGGHTELAAKRAARYGNGFFPGRGDVPTLTKLFDAVAAECARVGRDAGEIELSAGFGGGGPDDVRRMEDLGVSRLAMGPPAFDIEGVERGLETFADAVISKL